MVEQKQTANGFEVNTQYVSYRHPSDLVLPAQLIARGEVVAFPTETVYGLGACATNISAIKKIYAAKGRPQDNPLIVHVADAYDIQRLVRQISPLAKCLIDAFMPGPITLVMPKSEAIPDEVTAGLDTVGIRIPANEVARALIKKAAVPVAAPSANISGRPSPTRAAHVCQDLNGKIACVLDAGPCAVGLESTVVDVTGNQPHILRPGAVTSEMILNACRSCGIDVDLQSLVKTADTSKNPKSPGLKYKHYAPDAEVRIINYDNAQTYVTLLVEQLIESIKQSPKQRKGVFCACETKEKLQQLLDLNIFSHIDFYCYGEREDVFQAGQNLFSALRALDNKGVKQIFAPGFSKEGQGGAYMNRLEKASETNHDKEEPIRKRVLFVCTGNTCRSPMAEAILNYIIQRERPFYLQGKIQREVDIIASSAGIFAADGQSAAANAIKTMHSLYGQSLEDHESRSSNEQIIIENDLVFAVTADHATLLRSQFPEHSNKVFALKEYADKHAVFPKDRKQNTDANIPDPYERDLIIYEQTATALYGIIEAIFPYMLDDLGVEKK